MKKIVIGIILIVIGFVGYVFLFPSKTIIEMEAMQNTLVEIGYHDILKNDIKDYMDSVVELSSVDVLSGEYSFEELYEKRREIALIGRAIEEELSYIAERIEEKEVTVGEVKEVKNLSLEIISDYQDIIYIGDAGSGAYSDEDIEIMVRLIDDIGVKIEKFNGILNKYFD